MISENAIAAASLGGAKKIFTKDLNDRQLIEDFRIENQ